MSAIALPRAEALGELAARFGGTLDHGLERHRIERIVSPAAVAADGDLTIVVGARFVERARDSRGILLCANELAARLPAGRRWNHSHPMWVVCELLGPVDEQRRRAARPPDGGQVAKGAELAPSVRVLPGAVIFERARIGADSLIGPNAVIYPDAVIGERCELGANTVIYGGVTLGARVLVGAGAVLGRAGFGFTSTPDGEMVRVPQLGGVLIEDDVEIGALCTVDSGTLGPTRIGRGAKLDAHVHVGHNAQIGEQVLVAAQAGFAGSSEVGPRTLIAGQAGVSDHVRIGAGARVAAKSGVIGDVPDGATVAGFPAVPRIQWLRAIAASLREGGRGKRR